MTKESQKTVLIRKIIFYIVIFFFLCGLGAVYYSTTYGNRSKKGLLRLHGWVEGTEVCISSKVKGNVIELTINEGYDVGEGQLIAKIDSEQIRSQLEDAEAYINRARELLKRAGNHLITLKSKLSGARITLDLSKKQSTAKIKEAQAGLEATKAVLKQAKINFKKAEKDYNRFLPLIQRKVISRSKMDSVEERYEFTKEDVERAKRELLRNEARLALAQSTLIEVRLRENDLITLEKELIVAQDEQRIARTALDSSIARRKEIEANLDDTLVYSPVEGTVTDKMIELGENVVLGTPLAIIVDMTQLYVKTYVEQVDIGKVKLNDPCRIYVDSFPNRYFEGKVILVAPKAEFTPRDIQMDDHRSNMVYKIKVGINNPEGILKPGMPADVDLKWDDVQSWG
ncbi:MAG: efflux RND transporter periplasmic adaptor subunit [Thermodesulfobacteriota bacterium]|nr:efflux RND transporter periplasmic adaptor subunit [Thermodesulfobacteriota bacterium]